MSGCRALGARDSEILGGTGLRDRQAIAGFPPGRALGPSSLHWVRNLLPGEEGTAWWAEVISCLSETTDPGRRRQYVRSYRRSVPKLVWTSWTSGVSRVAPAPMGVGYRSVEWKGMDMAFSPEDKFGIKVQSKPGPRTIDQKYSVLLGLVVLVLGILGFILTGFAGYTEMTDHAILGLFQTN
ncbi:MAG: hypothetical protein ACRDRO_10995 [Pseudonocardiaceae bacterium]